MSKKLSAEDRQAIDLLLERPDGHGDTPIVDQLFAKPARGHLEGRLEKVERILELLDAMPTAEPPRDLVSSTLRRIEEATLAEPAAFNPEQPRPGDLTQHA